MSLRSRRRGPAGYTLFAVLLAVAFMAGLVATYSRHVVVAGRGGMAAPALCEARETCHSGLAFARQALLAGEELSSAAVSVGDGEAVVSVVEKAGGHQLVSVTSVGIDGQGARRTAEVALRASPGSSPTGPASLPTLGPAMVNALLADPTLVLHQITQSQRLANAELSGLLVVHPGVELELADVVLQGAIVSASVLEQAPPGAFDPLLAPRVVVDGNLRIDPPAALPGVAVLLPDGAVQSGAADARVQLHGDVVAHDVALLHEGVLGGHVLGVNVSLGDPALQDRLGADRKPAAWSSALDLGGASEPVFLAIVPAALSSASLASIVNYWREP